MTTTIHQDNYNTPGQLQYTRIITIHQDNYNTPGQL